MSKRRYGKSFRRRGKVAARVRSKAWRNGADKQKQEKAEMK